MLQSIRDNAQGLVSKILVGLIAFTFVIWGADSLFTFSTDSGAPATVNGEDISLQKLAQKSELNRRQLLISNPDLDPVTLDMQTIQTNTLEQLIKQEIFLQLAAESSMAFGTSSVDQMIVDTPEFQVEGKFDIQRFQSLIGGAGLTANTYKQQLIESNLLNQINQGVTATAFSLPEQVNLIAKLDGQTRSIDTLVLSFAQQLENTDISAEQIATHFADNQERYISPEQMQVEYVLLNKDQFASQVTVTDADIEAAYNESQQQFVAEAEREVAHILFNVNTEQTEAEALTLAEQAYQALEQGTDFAQVAAEFSQDAGTANDGGSLGTVLAGDFGGNFDETLFGLQEGSYSKPVVTQFGVQIIKLHSIVETSYPSFAEQKDGIKANLQSQGAEALYVAASESFADIAFSSSDLQELSDEFDIEIKQSAWFGRTGVEEFGEVGQRVADTAFADEVLVENNNSEVIELSSDELLVVRLLQHKPSAPLELAEVSEGIRLQLAQQQALEDLQLVADEYVEQLNSGANEEAIAAQTQTEWQSFDDLARFSTDVSPMLTQAAFKLPRPQQGDVFGTSLDFTGDVSIIRLRDVTDGNTDDLGEDQRLSLAQALSNIQGQSDIAAFEADLNSKAEIERF